jgi:zinc protease
LFVSNTPAPTALAKPSMRSRSEVRRIAEEGPTQKSSMRPSYLKGSQMLRSILLEAGTGAAAISARQIADRLYRKRNAIVDAVTLDDAQKAAKRLWGQGLLTVIVGACPAGCRAGAAALKAN